MEKTKAYKISLSGDLQGLSIGIVENTIIDGEVYTKPVRRRAFRKVFIEENGAETINENFEAEVDEWTGEIDFIKNKVNF